MFKFSSAIARIAYWILVVALFAWAAWRRFSIPLEPVADLDTWGYLSPALLKLTGGEFIHVCGRNFVYPGFLLLVLQMFGDFRSVVVVQHLLGLAGGGLLLLTWQRVRVFVAPSAVGERAHLALGLFLIAVFLLAGEPIRAEMGIRPEAVCGFLLASSFFCLVEFLARTFVLRKAAVTWGIAVAITALLLASVKPSFVFLGLVPLLPVGIFLLTRNPLRQKVGLALGILIAAATIMLPEYFLSRKDELGRLFLPTTLFVIHADLIRDQMADDVAKRAVLPYQIDWLQRVQKELAAEIMKSGPREGYRFPSLGFSPDDLMYGTNSIAEQLDIEFNDDVAALTSFYRFYYWRTWQQRPLEMAKKIGRQVALFYQTPSPVFDRRKVIPLAEVYKMGAASFDLDSYREHLNAYPPARQWLERSAPLAEATAPIEQGRVIRLPIVFLAVAYLPLLGITLMSAVVCLRSDFRKRLGWLTTLTLLAFAYNAAACLEVAIVATFDGPRYSTVQFCCTVFAEFLALWLLVELRSAVYSLRRGR
ncbi:MAG TPA: hypothetical protein VH188_04640 [Chthoniobacterales bacterium]|jgi:hypothetical protein|nr:hypothetical protein [Chthoniobacterales bacterium]